MNKINQPKIPIEIKPLYKLEKLENHLDQDHPNGFNKGWSSIGNFDEKPIKGKGFVFYIKDYKPMITSPVIEVKDNGIFTTLNSTYKLSKYDENN